MQRETVHFNSRLPRNAHASSVSSAHSVARRSLAPAHVADSGTTGARRHRDTSEPRREIFYDPYINSQRQLIHYAANALHSANPPTWLDPFNPSTPSSPTQSDPARPSRHPAMPLGINNPLPSSMQSTSYQLSPPSLRAGSN